MKFLFILHFLTFLWGISQIAKAQPNCKVNLFITDFRYENGTTDANTKEATKIIRDSLASYSNDQFSVTDLTDLRRCKFEAVRVSKEYKEFHIDSLKVPDVTNAILLGYISRNTETGQPLLIHIQIYSYPLLRKLKSYVTPEGEGIIPGDFNGYTTKKKFMQSTFAECFKQGSINTLILKIQETLSESSFSPCAESPNQNLELKNDINCEKLFQRNWGYMNIDLTKLRNTYEDEKFIIFHFDSALSLIKINPIPFIRKNTNCADRKGKVRMEIMNTFNRFKKSGLIDFELNEYLYMYGDSILYPCGDKESVSAWEYYERSVNKLRNKITDLLVNTMIEYSSENSNLKVPSDLEEKIKWIETNYRKGNAPSVKDYIF